MSNEDPTRKYPPPESFQTRSDLEAMLVAVVTRVIEQKIDPQFAEINQRFDRLEARLERLEKGQDALLKEFRHFKKEAESRLYDLEYPEEKAS